MKAFIAIRLNTKLKLILVLITRLSLAVSFFFYFGIPNALMVSATSCTLNAQFYESSRLMALWLLHELTVSLRASSSRPDCVQHIVHARVIFLEGKKSRVDSREDNMSRRPSEKTWDNLTNTMFYKVSHVHKRQH